MKMTKARWLAGAALCGVLTVSPSLADPPAAAQSTATPPAVTIPGWDAVAEGIRDLPGRMLARLPETMQHDPQVQQEVARLALEGITSAGLEALGDDGDHPAFLPSPTEVLNIGQPNADTVYRMAKLSPGGTYRLRGTRGSLRMVRIAEMRPRPEHPKANGDTMLLGPPPPVHDVNTLKVDADGRFDVILSPTRPAGYNGDWWQLDPQTDLLLLRMVSADWGKERDPTISIERLDKPVTRPRPSAADLEQRLRSLPVMASFIAPLFVDHLWKVSAQGYVNKLKAADFSTQGGLATQFYYEGVYDLADDEALVIEVKPPAKCLYGSLILTNEIYETTDWINNQSSLNNSQYRLDGDGMLRVVVSSRDPGVPNWLDTAGYPLGMIQGRWTQCDSQPVPAVRKIKLSELRQSLPHDTPTITPEQREKIIRERRAAFMQRPLW